MVKFSFTKDNKPLPNIKFLAKLTSMNKPGLSVEDHCRVAGMIGRAIINRMPAAIKSLMPLGSAALVSLHDVGKINPCFQRHLYSQSTEFPTELRVYPAASYLNTKNHHALVSEDTIAYWLDSNPDTKQLLEWAFVPGAHHGGRRRQGEAAPNAATKGVYGGEEWLAERIALIEKLTKEFGAIPDRCPDGEDLSLVTGLTCVADWIASDEKWFDGTDIQADLESLVEKVLDEAGWIWPKVRGGLQFANLFKRKKPRSMQSKVFEVSKTPGLYIVEAPTGEGKTEAALWAAYRLIEAGHNHGIYFGLPTQLTSNLIHKRVNLFLKVAFGEDAAAGLLHGNAWLKTMERGGEEFRPGGAWFQAAKRGLLLPFGVGTVDQALLGVLKAKHNFLRLFGLAGKVVVLDEVHSYDMFTGTLIDKLVDALLRLGCSVIILSATLTRKRRGEFIQLEGVNNSYPLISVKPTGGKPYAVEAETPIDHKVVIKHVNPDVNALASQLGGIAGKGAAILWIVNTVDRAQECYRRAKSVVRQAETTVGLLHSRFPVHRREKLEDEWMKRLGEGGKRKKGCILVATQVMEQSVDVDADLLVTDLAPTDMILQRMGRLWRHERKDRIMSGPEVWIAAPGLKALTSVNELRQALGGSAYVYSPYVLWRTFQVWCDLQEISVPSGVRSLLESTYLDAPDPEDPDWVRNELWKKFCDERNKLRSLAVAMSGDHMLTMPDDETAETRYGSGASIPIVLAHDYRPQGNVVALVLADGNDIPINCTKQDFHAAKALHRNIVRLRRTRDLPKEIGPGWLNRFVCGVGKYRAGILLIGEDGTLRTVSGEDTLFAYTDELGLFVREEKKVTEEMKYEPDW